MQFSDVNGVKVSRFGLGTKRFPTEDSSRVVHLDTTKAAEIFEDCVNHGVNFFDTSYSNHKGEAEAFLGEEITKTGKDLLVCTSFFEMVDPRFDYVFQKQQKKLEKKCIDFYTIEGVTTLNTEINIDSGALDFFFECKEKGEIGQLGFSSELSADVLGPYLERYPWDFVRMRVNYFDWFEKGVSDAYEVATEAGIPIIAHGALRVGPTTHLKEGALNILKEADKKRSSIDWALRFVKSLDNVRTVTTNVFSTLQVEMDMAIFEDEDLLTADDFEVLKAAAAAQKARPNARK